MAILLSFVLNSEPTPVLPARVLAAHHELFSEGGAPLTHSSDSDEVAEFEGNEPARRAFVTSVASPIPKGEAEAAARFSVGSFGDSPADISAYGGHFIVTTQCDDNQSVDALTWHTRVVASVAKAHGSIAVYEGAAQATHSTAFYLEVATSSQQPILLWTGVSVARDRGRVSVLTLGLSRFGLPDLMLTASPNAGQEVFMFLFDLVGYILERGAPIPDGETVGRSGDERIPVRYVPNPVDPEQLVASIELPESNVILS